DGLWWRRRDECKPRKGIVACGKDAKSEAVRQRQRDLCGCDSIIRRYGESGIAFVCKQSQRDCVLQPKVARNELPWVIGEQIINRNAVAAIPFSFGVHVTLATTPLGLVILFRPFPRLARVSQPWALGRNPVGILGWRCCVVLDQPQHVARFKALRL